MAIYIKARWCIVVLQGLDATAPIEVIGKLPFTLIVLDQAQGLQESESSNWENCCPLNAGASPPGMQDIPKEIHRFQGQQGSL